MTFKAKKKRAGRGRAQIERAIICHFQKGSLSYQGVKGSGFNSCKGGLDHARDRQEDGVVSRSEGNKGETTAQISSQDARSHGGVFHFL